MKTVTLELYSFDELSETAKTKAIALFKERAAEDYSDFDWRLEQESEEWFLNLAGVKLCIEQSSQGFYCRWHTEINPDYDKTDEEQFRKLQQLIQDEYEDNNFNLLFKSECLNYRPNNTQSYSSYVADVVIAVCKKVYLRTMDYYNDTATIDYIRDNDFQFLKDGRRYKL